jgi:hypothetical protein
MDKRRWLGRRVWVAHIEGKRHYGTLWWEYEETVLIRQDGIVGLRVFLKASQGTHWGFADENGKTP